MRNTATFSAPFIAPFFLLGAHGIMNGMKQPFLERFFPTPAFLRMPAGGLDISDRSIKFLELGHTRGEIALGRYGEAAVPEGVITGGEIVEREELLRILREMHARLGMRFVNVSLPEEKSFIFSLELPSLLPSEVRQSIELALEEHIPLHADEAVFDFEVAQFPRDESDHLDVNVSVMPRVVAELYLDVLNEAGFVPLAFELEGQAIARAVVREGDQGTFMAVDFGATRTSVSIVERGVVWFTTSIAIGGKELTNAIVKDFGVSFADAERIKIEQGLGQKSGELGVYASLIATLSVLRDELSKHYQYWNERHKGVRHEHGGIEKIIMCGGDAVIPGIIEFLTADVGVSVTLGNPWINVFSLEEHIPSLHSNDAQRYTPAIGLALRGFAGNRNG